MEVWYCDNCGSTDVQEKIYIAINSGKIIEDKLWYEYKDTCDDEFFFCNGCRDECTLTLDKPKGEDNGEKTNAQRSSSQG